MAQLSLFAGGSAPPESLELATPPADVIALASELPRSLFFATQSWAYPGWIGGFYAPGTRAKALVSRGLTAYAQHPLLRSVEIDRSFYLPPTAAEFAELAAQVPDGFRFVVKAHEDLTVVRFPAHPRYGARAGQRNPRLLDAAYARDVVIAPVIEGLAAKAGPIVFQFSPFEVHSPPRFAEALHRFLSALPRGPIYAVELRNRELLTPAYGAALADAGAIHVHNAWGRLADPLAQRELVPAAARRVLVARWLMRSGDSHEAANERYDPFDHVVAEDLDHRDSLAALVADAIADRTEVFVTVNNKAEGCAHESIRRLAAAVVARRTSP